MDDSIDLEKTFGTKDVLAVLLRSGSVMRYHAEGEPRLYQSVADHSWRVAVIVNQLWPQRGALVTAALYHDCAELLTGDLPAPFKRNNKDIAAAMETVEASMERALGVTEYLNLVAEDRVRLKIADYADLCARCLSAYPSPIASKILFRGKVYIREQLNKLPIQEREYIDQRINVALRAC